MALPPAGAARPGSPPPAAGAEPDAPLPPAARERSLLWGASWTAVYTLVTLLVRVARGLVIPKLLAPAVYGLWSSLSVVIGYSQYADLGVQQQLAKRLPWQLGREGPEGYWRLASKGVSWTVCVSAAVAVVLWGASFLAAGDHAGFYRPALRLLALALVAQSLRMVLIALLNARQEFRAVTLNSIFTEVLALVLALAGLLAVGVLGLVWALLLAEAAGAVHAVYTLRRAGEVRLSWDLAGIPPLIREGLLLLAVGLAEMLLMTMDQLFLLRFFSKAQYGIYAFGSFLVTALIGVSAVFLAAQPRILELWARGERERAGRVIDANVSLYVLVAALCVGPFVAMVDVLTRFYLRDYAAGMVVFVLMPLVALFRGPVILLRSHFLARDRERRLLAYQAAGVLAVAAADAVIVWRGWPLPCLAAASAGGYLLVSAFMFRELHLDRAGAARARYAVMAAAVAGGAGLFAFYARRGYGAGAVAYAAESLAACLVYLALLAAVVLATRRSWGEHLRLYAEGGRVRVPRFVTRLFPARAG